MAADANTISDAEIASAVALARAMPNGIANGRLLIALADKLAAAERQRDDFRHHYELYQRAADAVFQPMAENNYRPILPDFLCPGDLKPDGFVNLAKAYAAAEAKLAQHDADECMPRVIVERMMDAKMPCGHPDGVGVGYSPDGKGTKIRCRWCDDVARADRLAAALTDAKRIIDSRDLNGCRNVAAKAHALILAVAETIDEAVAADADRSAGSTPTTIGHRPKETTMLTSTRAKFRCEAITERRWGDGQCVKEIELQAVMPRYKDGKPDAEDPNTAFFKASPSGQIKLGVLNPAAAELFATGREYFIDFTPVDG